MKQPAMDWDPAYRQDVPPPWSIGGPQPELAALIEADITSFRGYDGRFSTIFDRAAAPGRDNEGNVLLPSSLLSAHRAER